MKKTTFIAATNNAHKLAEMRAILANAGFGCMSLAQAGIDVDPEESGATVEENSYIKAKAVFDAAGGRPVLADDTGRFVDALDGAPGVHTARYAGGHDYAAGVDKLLAALADRKTAQARTARFVSAATAILPDGSAVRADGVLEGYIGFERRGEGGFGYDPVFMLRGNHSLAQLSEAGKNAVSHRGRSVRKLVFKLRNIKKMRG
ncbi:MAG: RdgB/HAM1 family non-canonical purine NTP pyrophosphatase [Oscillospiraceae bacterium]|nr:RdgB/HAM1 family non-canonical purine NTP pyrophosphatase [Oscillospiraceae bacterium]